MLNVTEREVGDVYKLYDAVAKACSEFPPLPRTATGQVGKDRKFKYAPYHKVVECIRPHLAANGITFHQALHTENDGVCSMTLVVAGHGAAIYSRMQFPRDNDIKVFGADVTYNKRYQLTAFFGLEGDPDADDFDSSEVRSVPKSEPKAAPKPESKPSNGSPVAAASGPKNEPKPVASTKEVVEVKEVKKTDNRPISERLNDAMKQLNWGMDDFNAFCSERQDSFPNFTSAAKLSVDGKEKLWSLLVSEQLVAPF